MRNTHRGRDQRQRDPERRPTQMSNLEKNTQAGISTDPQTSPGHTPSPSQPQSHSAPPRRRPLAGTVLARRVEPQTPGCPGTRAQGAIPDPGSARREAHTKTQPGQQEQAPPVRTVTPDHPPPGHSHHTHTEPQHPICTPRDPALPRPTQSQPPGRAVLTSCRQQKATSVQRPLHLPMAPGAARAVRRGAPLAQRPPPPPRRTGSASFP